jgi:hypothetical protein
MQLDQVARWVVQERLPATRYRCRVAYLDTLGTHKRDCGIDVFDMDGEVLTTIIDNSEFEQVQLVATEVEPRPVESKVWAVSSECHPENIGVELDRYIRVMNVDRYMVDSQRLHDTILAGSPRCVLV